MTADEVFLHSPQEWSTRAWHQARPAVEHELESWHRPRLELAATVTANAVLATAATRVVDLGAGAGGLLTLIAGELARLGLGDVEIGGIEWHAASRELAAAKGIQLIDADIITAAARRDLPLAARSIVTATELVEHLEGPHELLGDLYADDRITGIVISSPRNETADNYSEGHRWAWTEAGYRRLVTDAGWTVGYHGAAGLFQVLYATRGGTP